MDAKRWALVFVYLLSSSYVGTAVAQTACQPNQRMEREFERAMEEVRTELRGETFNLQDDTAGNLQMTGGKASDLHKCKINPPVTCACHGSRMVRMFIKLSFLDVTITFVVTLLDDLLGGILGNLGKNIARLVGQVVNLVVSLTALEINVVITVEQKLVPGSTCTMTDFRVTRISEIKILNIDLTELLLGLLGEVLTPVLDTVLRLLLEQQVRPIIARSIQKVRITPDMFTCG